MNHKKIILFLILFMAVVACDENGAGDQYPHIPNGINAHNSTIADLCSKTGDEFGHTVVIIDTTTPLDKPQRDWIDGKVFHEGFFKGKAYTRFSYLLINNTPPPSQEYQFSKCMLLHSSQAGKNMAPLFMKPEYDYFFEKKDEAAEKMLAPTSTPASHSLIYETIASVFDIAKFQFKDDGKSSPPSSKRHLIIVSDMMQNDPTLTFYQKCRITLPDYSKGATTGSALLPPASTKKNKKPSVVNKCPTFAELLKDPVIKNYIDTTTPKVNDSKEEGWKDTKVTIMFLNHWQQGLGLSKSLQELWEGYFLYAGAKDVTWEPQLKIPPGD